MNRGTVPLTVAVPRAQRHSYDTNSIIHNQYHLVHRNIGAVTLCL